MVILLQALRYIFCKIERKTNQKSGNRQFSNKRTFGVCTIYKVFHKIQDKIKDTFIR